MLGTTFADSHAAADADKQPDLDDLFAELEKDVSQPAVGTIWLEYLQTKLTKFTLSACFRAVLVQIRASLCIQEKKREKAEMKAQKNTEQFEAENNMTHAFADLQDESLSTSEFPRLFAPRRVWQLSACLSKSGLLCLLGISQTPLLFMRVSRASIVDFLQVSLWNCNFLSFHCMICCVDCVDMLL